MKKLFLAILITACALLTATAQDNTNSGQLFNGNELSLSLSSGYSVDNGFQDDYTFNFSVGSQYFVTKNLGVEAVLPFYDDGVTVREVSFGALGRVSLVRNVATYIGAGACYDWQTKDDNWDYYLKAGLEGRLNSKWGAFLEYQYRVDDVNNQSWNDGNQRVVAGLRLVF